MGGGALGGGAFVTDAIGGGALGGVVPDAEDAEPEDVVGADDPSDWPPGRSCTSCRSRALLFFFWRLTLRSLADLILSEAVPQ